MTKKKEFKLFDAVLAAVCIVLVVEAAAPVAAIGPMQYLWWAIALIGFFLPYGLISAELGTAYEEEGGLYDWVKTAFGRRAGAHCAWYYWLNFPLWMASLAVLFTDILGSMLGFALDTGWILLIRLGFVWLCVFISNYQISQSKWLINVGTFVKVALIVSVGVLGIYGAVTKGFASSSVAVSPLQGVSFVSVILFNFLGFEVVTTFANDMRNPSKEIPQAIIVGGVLIAVFYLFAAFGISVAIPAHELSVDSGLMDAFALLTNTPAGGILILFGAMFMFTLFANLASWSFGVNYVALYAARDHAFPKIFAKENKEGVPASANLLNGIIASAIVVGAALVHMAGGDVESFWTMFALNVVILLMSYMYLFPSFYRLRKTQPDHPRPFRVGGGKAVTVIFTVVPMVLLILAIFFSLFPYDMETGAIAPDWSLITGVAITVVAGQIMSRVCVKKEPLSSPHG